MIAKFNDEEAVYLGVWPTIGSNEIEVSHRLHAEIARITPTLPPDIQLRVAYDGTIFMQDALKEITKTLMETILIVAFVVFLFLGSVRTALVPLVAMPVSLIGAGIVMMAFGFSLNLLTILAIVLSVGLVVDDAIVVVENVERHVRQGQSRIDAALIGARELLGPIIAMTITLAVVYTPIGFQGGLTGSLFLEFAITLAAAVVVSGIVAVTLSPVMSSRFVHPHGEQGRLTALVHRGFELVRRAFAWVLDVALEMRWAIVAAALLIMGAAWALYVFSRQERAPVEDQSHISFFLEASPDSTLAATNRESLKVVSTVASFPEAKFMWSLTAAWGGFGGMVTKDWHERARSTEAMYGEVFGAVSQAPGLRVFPRLDPPLPTPGQYDVELVLQSDAPAEQMLEAAGAVLGAGWQSGKFLYVDTDLKIDLPQARVVLDRERLADLGLDLASVGQEFGTLLGGAYVNRFNFFDRSYKVIPQIGDEDRATVGPLLDLKLKTPGGQLVPVSTFTHIESSTAPRTLNRFQQRNAVRVFGGVKPGVTKEEGLRVLETAVAAASGPGVVMDYAGESRQIRREGSALTVTLGFALVLIYLVLAAQFHSFRDPLIVLLGSVPLAISGALIFSFLDLTTINIYSQVGLITLVGLIAKNGILIVQFANTLQSQGVAEPGERCFTQRGQLRHALRLERIGELHDQDAVFRYQSHQRDQPDLGVDVDGGEIEVAEHQRPGNRERHRAHQHDQRVPEAPELRREHQIDQDHGESEGHGERRAFESDLPRFAGVVQPDAGAVTAFAAFSNTRSPSSLVTPGFTPPKIRTAFLCWNRFSVRGAVLDSMCVNVDTGTSRPLGVLILRSSSGATVVRRSSPIWGMTL